MPSEWLYITCVTLLTSFRQIYVIKMSLSLRVACNIGSHYYSRQCPVLERGLSCRQTYQSRKPFRSLVKFEESTFSVIDLVIKTESTSGASEMYTHLVSLCALCSHIKPKEKHD